MKSYIRHKIAEPLGALYYSQDGTPIKMQRARAGKVVQEIYEKKSTVSLKGCGFPSNDGEQGLNKECKYTKYNVQI